MTTNAVPTLSSSGWVKGVATKCDYLISHFYTSEANQTEFYPGNVASLPELLAKYQHDPLSLGTQIQTTMHRYLSRHFDTADVDCSCTDEDGKVYIRLSATVEQDGVKYSFCKQFETTGTVISKIINLVN
jgi:hypothetical protein